MKSSQSKQTRKANGGRKRYEVQIEDGTRAPRKSLVEQGTKPRSLKSKFNGLTRFSKVFRHLESDKTI